MPSRALARVGMLHSGEIKACLPDAGVVKARHTVEWHTVKLILAQPLKAARKRPKFRPKTPTSPGNHFGEPWPSNRRQFD